MSEKIGLGWLLPFLMFFAIGYFHLSLEYPLTIQYLPDNNSEDIMKGYTEVTYMTPLDYAPRAILEINVGALMSLLLYNLGDNPN